MNRSIAISLAAAVVLAAAPALADWENTRWGDGVDKVIADVGQGARPDQGDKDQQVFGKDRLASREGEYLGLAAEWQFFFDAKGGLAVVKIKPKDYADCEPFVAKVKGGLGKLKAPKTQSVSGFTFSSWSKTDRKANLAIMVVQVTTVNSGKQICHVTYQPYGKGKPGPDN